MKKLLKLTVVAFVLVNALIFTGCQKQQFSYDDPLLTREDFENLPKERIVSVTKNYTEEETGLTGTLYVVKVSPTKTQEFFLLNAGQANKLQEKKFIIFQRGRYTYHDPALGGDGSYDCSGAGEVNCWILFGKMHLNL